MPEFLTTKGTSYHIEKIIKDAKHEIVLITPFLKVSDIFLQRLIEADNQNVPIVLVYGKEELNPNEKDKLNPLRNLSLFFHKDLHAKCYFNEEFMVISSMNMHEFSEQNNREMGILIKQKEDANLFNEAEKEARSIIGSATKEKIKATILDRLAATVMGEAKKYTNGDHSNRTKNGGFCI